MTIRELQFAIQSAIDDTPYITDSAEVAVKGNTIFAMQSDPYGAYWHKLGEIKKEG